MKGINEDISAAETDMSMVTLLYQKLKAWRKMPLEERIVKWPEAQRVVEPQINAGLVVAAAAELSVTQEKMFLCKVQTLQ